MATDIITTIGATSSPVTPDYSTIQAWEDAIPADLVSADERHIGECLDQGTFVGVDYIDFGGITTDGTRNVILRCAAGASFKDKAGVRTTALRYNESNGVSIEVNSIFFAIRINPLNVTLEGLQVWRNAGYSAPTISINDSGPIINSCIIKGNLGVIHGNAGASFRNCLIEISAGGLGIVGYVYSEYINCTIVQTSGTPSGTGVHSVYGQTLLKNTAVFGFEFTKTANNLHSSSDYNATDTADDWGVGSNNLNSLTFADQFESTTNDFRTKSTGDLLAGTPDPTNIPNDISETAREDSVITIGCWEVDVNETVNTIGFTSSPTTPDYSTLQAWEDASPADLIANNEKWIGECLDQGEFTGTGPLVIGGITTSYKRNIVLKCADGASFRDQPDVRTTPLNYDNTRGVAVFASGGYVSTAIVISGVSNTRLEGLQLSGQCAIGFNVNNGNSGFIEDCILVGQAAVGGRGVIEAADGVISGWTILNTLIIQNSSAGNGVELWNGNTVIGCTFIGSGGGIGFHNQYGTQATTLKNCAIFGFATFSSNLAGTNVSHNATDLTGIVGSNNQEGLTFADQFIDDASDYRAVSTGDLQAGTPDANIPDDISGAIRNGTTPWIGSWELVPFLSGWSKRKPIRYGSILPASDLSDKDLLVKIIDDADIGAELSARKFAITSADGVTQVPYGHYNDFDVTGGECNFTLRALFDLDSSYSYGNFIGYIYYDDSQTDQSNRSGLADGAGYELFMPLEEDPSGSEPQMLDWTSNSYDGTSAGSMTSGDLVAGQVGKGLDFDGSDDYVDFGNVINPGAGSLTMSVIYKNTQFDNWWAGIWCKGIGEAADPGYGLFYSSHEDGQPFRVFAEVDDGSNDAQVMSDARTDDGQFHQAFLVFDRNLEELRLFIDGVLQGSPDDTSSVGSISTLSPLQLGRRGATNTQGGYPVVFNGTTDESTLTLLVRSADWITFTYENEFDNASTVILGAEEFEEQDTFVFTRLEGSFRGIIRGVFK